MADEQGNESGGNGSGTNKGGNGRDALGRFVPGCTPPPRKALSLAAYLKALGDELAVPIRNAEGQIVETTDRAKELARKVWADALSDDTDVRRVTQARQLIFERLAPPPRDGLEVTIIPAQTGHYTPTALTFLTELDTKTGGHPTTQQVLDHLAAVPLDRLLSSGNE